MARSSLGAQESRDNREKALSKKKKIVKKDAKERRALPYVVRHVRPAKRRFYFKRKREKVCLGGGACATVPPCWRLCATPCHVPSHDVCGDTR